MTADTLRKLEGAYASYALAAESARTKRNEAIRQALAEGWTHAQIAEATGLTRGRIGQIATTGDDREPDRVPQRRQRVPGPNVENIRSSEQSKRGVGPRPKGGK